MEGRVSHNPLNGRFTMAGPRLRDRRNQDTTRCCMASGGTGYSYEDAKPQKDSNYWSCTENNSNNAWNVNFNSGNVNNNNKYNSNVVRPVAAYDGLFLSFLQSVVDAYKDCLRGKMTSPQAVQYMQIASSDLVSLAVELWTGTYTPGTSTCFLVKYPKLREVFAAHFRDRIVHHWVCMRLNPLFEERFVSQGNVSFNCRKGYGTDKAVQHVAEGMMRVSGCYRRDAWVFRGDLVGFFMSIDKDLLWYLLERFIKRWKKRYEREGWGPLCRKVDLGLLRLECMPEMYWDILLRTTEAIVKHHPENDCVLNSPAEWWHGLAPNKSLFTSPTGEPIGNLTTQLFANFLMSFFVAYVKYLYRRQNYEMAQFVDDFEITCDDLQFLLDSIPKLEKFLKEKLKLELHKDKRYLQPVDHGVLFVGTYIKPGRKYLSNRTLARFKERCEGFRRMMESRELSLLDVKRIEQVINSYLGFCKGRETYAARREAIEGMGPEFWRYFFVKGHFESIRARKEYREITMPYDMAA